MATRHDRAGPWESPEGRPSPQLDRFCQLTVPPEDLAELADWFELLIGYISGRVPPASAKQPQVTRKMAVYAQITRHAALAAATGPPTAQPARLGNGAAPVDHDFQATASSPGDEITLAAAADMLRLSPARLSQLVT